MLVIYGVSRYQSYLNTAAAILEDYRGLQPFPDFSKAFFSRDKKYGSTDRKQISHLCYCYFRLGKAMRSLPVKERILTGLLLCSDEPNKMLEALQPEMNILSSLPLEDKYSTLSKEALAAVPGDYGHQHAVPNIFPWAEELSEGVEPGELNKSFLVQPDLFLRLRPGKENTAQTKLENEGIAFNLLSSNCISLPNASRIEDIIELDKEAVVQDYNSQKIGDSIRLAIDSRQSAVGRGQWTVWDCCAASGGKSIMARDIMDDIDLTVSDIRKSILINLEKRFARAGIKKYEAFVADITDAISFPGFSTFDLVMADVPCTGSGTWGRTPEQLFYFDQDKIGEYAAKQRKIVLNAIPAVRPGGYFLYSTCSVFTKENESIAAFINEQGLEIVSMQLLKGYDKKADTLFAALFRKPL